MDHGHLSIVLATLPSDGWVVRRVARAWRDAAVHGWSLESALTSVARLKWLAREHWIWGGLARQLCRTAARDGRLEALEWLLRRHVPDESASRAAASHDQLEALQLLRAHACPWPDMYDTTPRVLEWACDNGHPCGRYPYWGHPDRSVLRRIEPIPFFVRAPRWLRLPSTRPSEAKRRAARRAARAQRVGRARPSRPCRSERPRKRPR